MGKEPLFPVNSRLSRKDIKELDSIAKGFNISRGNLVGRILEDFLEDWDSPKTKRRVKSYAKMERRIK